jgi:uncharacterized protein YidB (DUF937 family)
MSSDQNPAVPGGSVAKPLIIALLALLAARAFGGKGGDGGSKPAPDPAPRIPQPQSEPNALPDPGSILDGLGGLIKQFQQKGLGDAIDSWVNTGANRDVSSGQVAEVLPRDVVDELARRTGLSRDQVIGELAKMLPNAVDRLTPQGRLPTQAELQRLLS